MTRQFVPRKGAPKSRGGCLTCKIRRIKCDEAKPLCSRCTSTGRKCDGYVSKDDSPNDYQPNITKALIYNGPPGEPYERRSFAFFHSCTVGNFSLLFGSPPWIRLVLQASHAEPALQHAVAALGALHEHQHQQSSSTEIDFPDENAASDFAAQQYTQALTFLHDLLTKSDNRSIQSALIGAIMCIYYQVLQGNWEIAQIHLENSLKVLDELLSSQHSWLTHATEFKMRDSKTIDDDIVQAFARLDIEASCTLGHRAPTMSIRTATLDIPMSFDSILQARQLLYALTSQLHSFMRSIADYYKANIIAIPLPTIDEGNFHQTRLKNWDASFAAFLNHSATKLSCQEQQAANILSIQQKVTYMKAETCLYAEELIFDQFEQEFEDIVCLADYVIYSVTPSTRSLARNVVLTSDMGIIEALFWTAIKCRNVKVRRRAIDVLRRVFWQEGVWNAEMMAAIADKFVSMEEEGIQTGEAWKDGSEGNQARIPEWRRLHEHGWDMNMTGRRTTIGAGSRENGIDGEWTWYREEVAW